MAQYDEIAKKYAEVLGRGRTQRYAIYPSFLNAIGDVRGKEVLDLFCGEGIVAREMAQRGAARVVGVDDSGEIIEIAKRKNPPGSQIEYRRGRVGELGTIGQFDLVTGAFALHYAQIRNELYRMCRDIGANLKPEGLFVGVNNNPIALTSGKMSDKHGPTPLGPYKEGDPLCWTLTADGAQVPFVNYFWRQETYEAALANAGLSVEWINVRPTEEGRTLLGAEYWNEYLAAPSVVILRCNKKKRES